MFVELNKTTSIMVSQIVAFSIQESDCTDECDHFLLVFLKDRENVIRIGDKDIEVIKELYNTIDVAVASYSAFISRNEYTGSSPENY
jgi:hypothetical protein